MRLSKVGTVCAVVGLVTTSAVMGGVAVAVVTPTTVSACTSKAGVVRVLGTSVKCKKTEKKVKWNIRGPRGSKGPAGPTLDLTYFDQLFTTPAGLFNTDGIATCPEGTKVVSGEVMPGATASYTVGQAHIEPAQNAFVVRYGNPPVQEGSDPGGRTVLVRVVCAG